MNEKYEAVIGLEVHAQMLTKTKAYSNDINEYGAQPNTNVSVVSLAHPGALPMMNKKTIEYAIRLGLACHCNIADYQYFARKNYFYPDAPKNYQVTQFDKPSTANGYVDFEFNGGISRVRITRAHLEEDAPSEVDALSLGALSLAAPRSGRPSSPGAPR